MSVALHGDTIAGLSFIDGHGYRIGQVGSFVRIPMGYIDLFGVVSQVGAGAVPERVAEHQPYGDRWMTVQLAGEADRGGAFVRGLSQHPTVGDTVHLVTDADLGQIYGRPDAPNFIRIGSLASADSIPALVNVDKLVSRHSAIVGTTGAGKSTTVAGILGALSDPARFPSARILVFDLHGEYAKAMADRARVFSVGTTRKREQQLFVPYWAMTFDELLSVTFGPLDDASRGAVLEKIVQLKREAFTLVQRHGLSVDDLTVDTPIPFSLHRLWFDLHRAVNGTFTTPGRDAQGPTTEALLLDGSGNPVQPGDAAKVVPPRYRTQSQAAGGDKIFLSASPLNIRRQLEALASRLRDPRFDFLFQPGRWATDINGKPTEDLDSLLKSWIGEKETISILDLSGVPVAVTIDLVGAILRIIYDALLWGRHLSEGGRERPLLVVLEEAHAYLGHNDDGPAGRAVRRIVKEGRKYGIGAMIVSQRPSEIDSTILSQCGTIFAMRLSNQIDRGHISSVVSDNLEGLLGMLPILRTGEAIVVGEAVHLPMRTLVDAPPPDRRPDSNDPLVHDAFGPGGWARAPIVPDYQDILQAWRRQDPRVTHRMAREPEAEGHMQLQSVDSTSIAAVGYDASTMTLRLQYRNGNVYDYFDVPAAIHEQLMAAGSMGAFVNAAVKPTYRYVRV